MYMFYFLRLIVFFQGILLDACVSCHSYAKIWFQSIIIIKLYLVIILNLYVTLEW